MKRTLAKPAGLLGVWPGICCTGTSQQVNQGHSIANKNEAMLAREDVLRINTSEAIEIRARNTAISEEEDTNFQRFSWNFPHVRTTNIVTQHRRTVQIAVTNKFSNASLAKKCGL